MIYKKKNFFNFNGWNVYTLRRSTNFIIAKIRLFVKLELLNFLLARAVADRRLTDAITILQFLGITDKLHQRFILGMVGGGADA